MALLFGTTILCLAALLAESLWLRRARRTVPRRILVTGTRGKSSLVRILTAACRREVPATLGKTTGDRPELLMPDGSRRPLRRRGPARLIEQARLLGRCRELGVECLVVESMTITPEIMQAEARLLQPTVVAVVDVRDDHRETLGADPAGQRAHYLAALPPKAVCLTRDRRLREQASSRPPASRPRFADPADDARPPDGNGMGEGPEVALLRLAIDVLRAAGLDTPRARDAARRQAARMVAEPHPLPWSGRTLTFLDAFSANDPESLTVLWDGWRRRLASRPAPWSVLLATRADRPLRTLQFCRWLAARDDVGEVLVAGSHAPHAVRVLARLGVPTRRVRAERGGSLADVLEAAGEDRSPRGDVLVGVGNAGGDGLLLRRALRGEVA